MTKNLLSLDELVARHRKEDEIISTAKIDFSGVGDADVYNICHEFSFKGKKYIAGRVEERSSEISRVVLFEKESEGSYRATDVCFDMLQDPCQCRIDGKLVIGGTKIETDDKGMINNWYTTFFIGDDTSRMTSFGNAPRKMKDVRIIKTDKIHVFTRPQGGVAGAGKIGYISASDISEVNASLMEKAVLLDELFPEGSWGGANQLFELKDGRIGVLGHVAKMTASNVRHYYAMTFWFDTRSKEYGGLKVIAERSDLNPGATKRQDLIDVVFSGGLTRNDDGTATLYMGVSDAEAHYAVINDPFKEYEV